MYLRYRRYTQGGCVTDSDCVLRRDVESQCPNLLVVDRPELSVWNIDLADAESIQIGVWLKTNGYNTNTIDCSNI